TILRAPGNEEIEVAIIVIVSPAKCASTNHWKQPGLGGHVAKSSVAIVLEENLVCARLISRCHRAKDIGIAIVIVIGEDHFGILKVSQAGLAGDIGKSAVTVIL